MAHRQRSTLVADITQELRQMISTGKVQPGEFLPSRKDLAAQFGVGLSTVHEAIRALTAVGMVESRPGQGTWVRHDALETRIYPAVANTRLGELNAGKVYEARSVIEVGLTEFAAQRASRIIPQDTLNFMAIQGIIHEAHRVELDAVRGQSARFVQTQQVDATR